MKDFKLYFDDDDELFNKMANSSFAFVLFPADSSLARLRVNKIIFGFQGEDASNSIDTNQLTGSLHIPMNIYPSLVPKKKQHSQFQEMPTSEPDLTKQPKRSALKGGKEKEKQKKGVSMGEASSPIQETPEAEGIKFVNLLT